MRLTIATGLITDGLHLLLMIMLHTYLSDFSAYHFFYFNMHIQVSWSTYAMGFFCFSIGLIMVVARFSLFYLHRDVYFYKFFALLSILQLAVTFLLLTNSSESIFIGWELLGLSSVLLIAFYEHRSSALKNSLIILVIYKIADVLFYSALIGAAFWGKYSYVQIEQPFLMLLILLACLIKSSLFPWIWLPRAMEGPTPSSAIFYGGIATHIPIFLFLNLSLHHPFTHSFIFVVVFSILTIVTVLTSLLSRQASDAKSAIAYASITQMGLIYGEILLGWYTFALIHTIVNGSYRTMEFIKSPSLIYNRRLIETNRKNSSFPATHYSSLFTKLYQLTYHEFYLPRLLIHCIEWFLGLHNTRAHVKATRNYLLNSLLCFLLFEFCIYTLLHIKISLQNEVLFLLGISFNVLSTLFKYKPIYFFMAISASTLTVFTILFNQLHASALPFEWLYFFFMLTLLYQLLPHKKKESLSLNYTGKLFHSTAANLIILIVGISLLGIPGLTSYLIWERLEHQLLPHSPDLIINGFFILALNTIVFFRFYYSNFLGKPTFANQYETFQRR
ncbi:MAG: proton-conducting transporter membrane subunit [Legionellaceae bacterium]|nr:proton-conducting transporter membrane subunit [Legionellaceae bacterium]